MVCPKSFVTAQSLTWVEAYLVRRKLGDTAITGSGARDVEAFLILEHELTRQADGGDRERASSSGKPSAMRGKHA